jgi:diguanylate cyclase (GGDEF)-like protein
VSEENSAEPGARARDGPSPQAARGPGAGPSPDGAEGESPAEPHEADILEERGEVAQSLIEIAARDLDRTDEDERVLARERERKVDTFYSDLLYTLANIRYPEDEARLVWVNLLTHKAEMSMLLGRNVGVRVAALDFFRNVLGSIGDVKIMASNEFLETAKLAITDGLTGTYNHRYFQDRLAREIEAAARERTRVSLLMIDIDHFKLYNDMNGHIAGDVALREVAAILKRSLKRDDVVARYGGEEFAVVLAGVDKANALEIAERVRSKVESLPIPNEKELPGGRLTVSVGVATYPEDATDRGELIEWADLSLYLAKTGGRNRAVAVPLDRRHAGRAQLDLDARISSPDQGEEERRVHVVDIGVGGLAMTGEGLPPSGRRLRLVISGPELEGEIAVKGRVAWRRPDSKLGELAGVEFVRPASEVRERIKAWLERKKGR